MSPDPVESNVVTWGSHSFRTVLQSPASHAFISFTVNSKISTARGKLKNYVRETRDHNTKIKKKNTNYCAETDAFTSISFSHLLRRRSYNYLFPIEILVNAFSIVILFSIVNSFYRCLQQSRLFSKYLMGSF